jgi:hypothetical protein
MKYYFQIAEDGKEWDDIKPIVLEFETRTEAVNIGYNLSKNQGKEVRLTDNEKMLNGSYILRR